MREPETPALPAAISIESDRRAPDAMCSNANACPPSTSAPASPGPSKAQSRTTRHTAMPESYARRPKTSRAVSLTGPARARARVAAGAVGRATPARCLAAPRPGCVTVSVTDARAEHLTLEGAVSAWANCSSATSSTPRRTVSVPLGRA
jgi:hypothetical protein